SNDKKEIIQEISATLANIEDIESSYMMDNGSSLFAIVNMTKGDAITRDQKVVNEEVLSKLKELQEHYPMKNVQSLMSVNMGSTVQVELKGEDYDTLQEVASDFSNQLRELDGVSAVSTSIDRTSIEKVIELNDEKMKDAGLTQE